ncbi:MAG: TPM domain-containing protein [Porphyromonadaceae bacterium]|nr:MAG: TPM domain-containing protein [Porphyromonadaceae bacterium]
MKRILAFSLILVLMVPGLRSQDFPEPMQPPRLVNDFANMLDQSDAGNLERKLLDFNNQTSTQIYVVTVPALNGFEPNDYTTRLAEKWKVGVKGKDNGVMILIKPKTTEEKGKVYIAVGYGLESVLTDAQANQIVDIEVLPEFRNSNYIGGINSAVNVIMKITSGEFTADQYLQKGKPKKGNSLVGLIIMIIIFSIIFGGRSRMNRHQGIGSGGGLPLLLLMGLLGGRGNGGSFGGFSSGGGFGGGFGGGGGGSFGGGGAGGSW